MDCLIAINVCPEEPYAIREALWRCAIVHYAKCFGSNAARFQLSAQKILKEHPIGLIAHNHFLALRNKHFVHDENSYSQSIPGAAINDGSKAFKIEKILTLNTDTPTLNEANYGNLHLLIQTVHEWVVAGYDKLCEDVCAELELESVDTLLARPEMQFRAPTVEDAETKKTFK